MTTIYVMKDGSGWQVLPVPTEEQIKDFIHYEVDDLASIVNKVPVITGDTVQFVSPKPNIYYEWKDGKWTINQTAMEGYNKATQDMLYKRAFLQIQELQSKVDLLKANNTEYVNDQINQYQARIDALTKYSLGVLTADLTKENPFPEPPSL